MLQFAPILAKLAGFDFVSILKAIKPVLPFAIAFGAGWLINGYRLDASRIEAELAAKDIQIEQSAIRANTAIELAASKDAIVAEWQSLKEASDARVGSLEANLTELSLRQPKDTTRIIDNTRSQADEIIDNDASYDWLRFTYPDELLSQSSRRITASKDYGLPQPALAGDKPHWP